MSDLIRTPTVIATEINSIKDQTRVIFLQSSVEIGKRLTEAKELVSHGEWGDWLKNNIDYSQSTANNLMQLYREYGLNSESLGNISYTKAIALLGVPKEEREQFVQENDVENMSSRELQRTIKEKQKLEKQLLKKEEKEKKSEIERMKLTKSVEQLEKELEKANAEKADLESIEQLQNDLSDSQAKIKKLESELKAKPIDVASVEVVPEEVENELAELRKKVSEQSDPASLVFKFHFETLAKEFKNLLLSFNEISNLEEKEKYKNAVSNLIDKMKEQL